MLNSVAFLEAKMKSCDEFQLREVSFSRSNAFPLQGTTTRSTSVTFDFYPVVFLWFLAPFCQVLEPLMPLQSREREDLQTPHGQVPCPILPRVFHSLQQSFFFYEEVLVNQCTFFYQAVRTMQFNPFSHLLWLPESPELHVRPRWSNEPESRVLKFLVELFLSSHLPHCIVSLLLFRLMIMISLAVCLSCKWSPSLWGRM